jgi:hypothetical protein
LDSTQYKENLLFIQNTLGAFVAVYDFVYSLTPLLTWEDERKTRLLLKGCILSALVTLPVMSLVPWRYVLLIGGVLALCAATAPINALLRVLFDFGLLLRGLDWLQGVQPTMPLLQLFEFASPVTVTPVVQVSLYENQRWWAGMGKLSGIDYGVN